MRRSRIHREEVQRSKPEAMPPDGYRSEGTPSLGEGPNARGKPFWLLFRRLEKVTRRKGGTLSRRYRSNGYAHKTKIKRSQLRREICGHPIPLCTSQLAMTSKQTPAYLSSIAS